MPVGRLLEGESRNWPQIGRCATGWSVALHILALQRVKHTKLIRQIVLTVTWTELKSSNSASLVC